MIKKLVVLSALIFCCASVFAQSKMDKATFEHLVDYANCQYLMAFIEKNDAGKPYINDTYEKRVKPVLLKATFDNLNTVPDYSQIKSLFSNGSNNSALQLAEKINDRKGKYEISPDNNSLIQSLGTTDWKGIDLKGIANKIQKKTITKFAAESTQNPTALSEQVVKNNTNQTSSQVDELQIKIDSLQQEFDYLRNDLNIVKIQGEISRLRLLVSICLGIIILLIVTLVLWFKLQYNAKNHKSIVRKFVKNIFFSSEEIKEKFEKYQIKPTGSGGNDGYEKVENRLNTLETQYGMLQSKVEAFQPKVNQGTLNQPTNQKSSENSNSSLSKENGLYFASKSNNQLTEQLPNSVNASFRVIAINGNEAKFEYVGVIRNENWFEGVCSIENSPNDNLSDKRLIRTVQPGKVIKENDVWVVTIPAKIRYI